MLSVGIAYAIYGIVFSTIQPFMGKLADKYGRIKFSIIANLVNSAGIFGYIFVTNVYHVCSLQLSFIRNRFFPCFPFLASYDDRYNFKKEER